MEAMEDRQRERQGHLLRIEYRSATGSLLAPGIALCDESTVIHGDGRIEFRRRGDFGEREDFPPGSSDFHFLRGITYTEMAGFTV